MTPSAIVTDIEGTTSSIAFVHDVLFPYSRARLAAYVAAHAARPDMAAILDAVRAEAGVPALDTAGCTALLLEWHDADRKIAPLKALQGLIWANGYATGALQGHVYPDAVAGLKRWHARGIKLYVYSSGSVAAQKLIFGHTADGDLTPLFSGYFDTAIGGKKEAASYAAVADAIGVPPGEILFLSDVAAELDAAASAGLMVTLLARDAAPLASPYPVAEGFNAILPEGAFA
ncbi:MULTISPECIES: acireductone synthase [unclassified Sphingomonas]|uniref:acireductone synthase n=1 Tax=unclassified Sphingomonas TaxID=196159 RepID=UPI00082F61D1|nr:MULTISPECIES: acireductone synthase [unclassified Sphingomonas]